MIRINQTNSLRVVAILWIVSLVISSFVFLIITKEVDAAPNAQMNYQGKLLNSSGVAVANGTYNMRFWLLASATAPTSSALWTESLTGANKVQVTNGLFSVMLGSTSPITGVDFNQTLYLGVEVGSTSAPEWDGEMLPRKILGTVPAAFEANRLDGLDSTQFVRTDATSTIEATTVDTLFTITQNGTGDAFRIIDGVDPVFTVADNGRVGIGTSTPNLDLVVDGDFGLVGGFRDNNASFGSNGYILKSTGAGVEWTSTSTLGFFDSTYFDTSEELANILTDETGSGLAVFGTNPLLSGFRSNASSTIGDGTGIGGLTIDGGATTTGNAFVAGASMIGSRNAYVGDGYAFSVNGKTFFYDASQHTDYDLSIEHSGGLGYSGTVNATIDKSDGVDETLAPYHAGVYGTQNGKNTYALLSVRRIESTWDATPAPLTTGTYLPGIGFAGPTDTTDGPETMVGASLGAVVDGTVSLGFLPSALIFHTSQSSSTALIERMRITSTGTIGIGTTTPSKLLTVAGDIFTPYNITAGSSTITYASSTGFTTTNASLTNATTTNLAATASFILGSDYISDITGTGLTLTNGVLSATGDGGSHWLYNGSRLSPSTTVGIGIFASSTIGDGTGVGGLTIAGGATTTGNMYLGGTLNFLNSASPNIFVNGGPTSTSISSSFLQHSVGIGNQALSFVSGASTVFGNIAIGTGVLYGSSSVPMTGDNNFGGGYQTLYNNTTGSNNNAIGRQALYYNTTGEQNVAVGRQALKNNVSGASSTALGANAGVTNISGSNNVFVGDEADALTSALNKATAIGSGAKVGCSNCLVLGGLGANYANVGIGTTTPSRLLTVQGGDVWFGGNITGTGTLSIAGGATTSALYATTLGLNNEYFTDLTGTGLTLVNGALTAANQSNWLTRNGALVPSTTVGIVVSASSTIGDGTGTGGLTIAGNSTTTGNNITLGTASTTNLIVSGITTDSTQCLQISATGLVSGTGSACGAGGGGGAGTWATTTSPVAGQNVNYTVDSNDIVAIGSNATATAEYWFNPNASIAYLSGSVGIGSTSPVSLLTLDKSGLTGPVIGGIKEYLQFTNSTEDAVYYGDNTMIVNAPTATSTLIGSIIRIKDDSDYPNTVRGLEVQAHRGTSTRGENTGINAFGRTFGIKGTTEGDAGEVARPAGVYAETRGSTQGNALRAYSGTLTTEDLVLLYHDTSAFTGTALEMDLGNGGGSFSATSSKFIDLKNAGVSQFSILSNGYTGIGSSTPSRQLTVIGDTYISGNITAASGTITSLLVTNGTTTNATSTNLFATNLRSTYASTTGLSGTNANITNATTTNLAATASFILGSDYISDITGTGLSVVNGALTAANQSNWLTRNGALVPSTTVGIVVSASSTIGDGTGTGGLTISGNSTTTGNAYLTGLFGINTTTPNAQLSITGTGNTNIFQFASSTGSNLLTLDTRGVLTFGTTTNANVFINGGPTSTAITSTLLNNIAIGNGAFSYPSSTVFAQHNIALGHEALYGSSSVPMTGDYNVALGYNALAGNTAGSYNIAQGWLPLYRNTTGEYNIAQGYSALRSNTTGSYNIAQGVSALNFNTTGSYNIAQGQNALFNNTTGEYNIAQGDGALRANTIGSSNIALGRNALNNNSTGLSNIGIGEVVLENNTSGSNNIALGLGALNANTTGANNIVIGYSAMPLYNGTGTIALGYLAGDALESGSNNIIIGHNIDFSATATTNSLNIGNLLFGTDLDGTDTTLSSGNIGIGSTTPSRKLTVEGDIYTLNNVTAASSTITYASSTGFTTTNASLTNATTTNLAATASFILGSDYISDITGTGLSLVNGALTAANQSNWLTRNGALVPSTTVGIVVSASSTIGDGTGTGGLTIAGTATTTNLKITALSDGCLNVTSGLVSSTGSACGAGSGSSNWILNGAGDALTPSSTKGIVINASSTIGDGTGAGGLTISGNSTTTGNVYLAGLFGINTTTPNAQLSITGTGNTNIFQFASSTGSNLLTLDTRGVLTFGTTTSSNVFINGGPTSTPFTNSSIINNNIAIGNEAFSYPSTIAAAQGNIALGYRALYGSSSVPMTGDYNIAFGDSALLRNTTGSYNIAQGYAALTSNTTGAENIALGFTSLTSNATGTGNIGLGYGSLNGNRGGSNNIAVGRDTLQANRWSDNNIGIGYQSLFYTEASDNIGLGYQTMYSNISGSGNIGLGSQALWGNSTGQGNIGIGSGALYLSNGSMNTAVGVAAGLTNSTGKALTLLGYTTSASSNNLSTSTAIGAKAIVGCSNCMVLGGLGADAQRVGIGTTTPSRLLTVQGGEFWLGGDLTSTGTGKFANLLVTGSSTIGGGTGTTGLTVNGNGTTTLNHYIGSRLAIGTTTPNAQLSITGTGNTNIFQFASSTGSNLLTLDTRGVLTFGTTTSSNVFINGGPTSTPFTNTSLLTSNVAIGNQAFSYPSSASLTESNIALGYRALYGSSSVPMTGDDNFAVGDRALYNNTTGSSNNAQGNLALFSNTSGMNNIAIGDQTLTANITGSNNIALGDTVLLLNTTGTDNIGLGQEVLYLNTNGSDNIALGETAMYSNTTGSHNIALGGGSSLYSNGALFNNLTGSYNIALGLDALSGNTTGSSSIGIGQKALFSNVSGASSTALGSFAGFTNVTGSNNLYLGDEADATGGGFSNTIAIGSHAKVGRSGALVLGGSGIWNTDIITGSSTPYAKFSIQNNYGSTTALFDVATTTSSSYATSSLFRINADGNVGIGTTSPSALLSITGTGNKNIFQFASSTGSNVLTLDTRGVLTFGTSSSADIFVNSGSTTANPQANKNNIAIGNGAFLYASTTVTPQNNIAIGFQALLGSSTVSLSGSENIAIGKQALVNNASGTYNVAIGSLALAYNSTGVANTVVGYGSGLFNTTGYHNTGVGVSSLQANTTGYQNAAVGYGALLNNTLGTNNTGMGWGSLASNSTGVENSAFGASTLFSSSGSYNTAQGYRALYANTTGLGNTAVGWQALVANDTGLGNTGVGYGAISGNTSGIYNTALGITAGNINTIGNANTYIGRGANAAANNFSTSTAIGANATVGCSNCMVLGGLNADYVNVGIGTTTPTSLLTLDKSAMTGAQVAGIKQTFGFTNSTLSAVYYGNETYITNVPTATSTLIGSIIRVADTSQLGNTVRAFEGQAHRGTNTKGENTGLSGFGRTFGVRGTTLGDAGDTFLPAGVFAETEGTTQGNALRAYSGTITTEDLVSLFHDTSNFTGTGLQMNFGNAGGAFPATTSAKFLDLQVAGTSKFTVAANGSTTIGDGTVNAGLRIPRGGICVDNDGSCISTTTGEIRSVTSVTGNSDLAEIYFSSQALRAGEIVSLAGGLSIERAEEGSEGDIIGVVSTKPGLLLGFDDTSLIPGETGYPVGLKGRVPIKLSTENGPIKKGDRIMLSSIPGIGMKAEGNARVVGIAMEDYDGTYGYSAGFLNQFGDDLAKERAVARKTETDLRTQDGCYYGGGNAQGEKACKPKAVSENTLLVTTSTEPTREEILAELRNEPALEMTTKEGAQVSIGQAIMFIELAWYQAPEGIDVLTALTATGTLIDWNGKEGETLWDRVKSLAQNFVDGVLSITGLKADKVEVKNELCVDGVCMNADDLRALLQSVNRDGNSTSPTPNPTPDAGNGGGGSTNEPPVDTGTTIETPSGDTSEGSGGDSSGGSGAVDEGSVPAEPEITETPPEDPEPPAPEPEPEPEPTPEPQPVPELAPAPAV